MKKSPKIVCILLFNYNSKTFKLINLDIAKPNYLTSLYSIS